MRRSRHSSGHARSTYIAQCTATVRHFVFVIIILKIKIYYTLDCVLTNSNELIDFFFLHLLHLIDLYLLLNAISTYYTVVCVVMDLVIYNS